MSREIWSPCSKCGVETDYAVRMDNRLCDFCTMPAPEVGMGVTYGCWTDRYVGTIIAVSPSGKSFTMQADTVTRTDSNGMSECQDYGYTPNPQGRCITFRLCAKKDGRKRWKAGNFTAGVGHRRAYHDFSF